MPFPTSLTQKPHWTRLVARNALPWLIWLAKNRKDIWYSEIDLELKARGISEHVIETQYAHPLGLIGDTMQEIGAAIGEYVPPVNALVINKHSGVPGKGCQPYLLRYRNAAERKWSDLTPQERIGIRDDAHQDIFDFGKKWQLVEDYLSDAYNDYPELMPFDGKFITPLHWSLNGQNQIDPEFKPSSRGESREESEAHKKLKQYILVHPEKVGAPSSAKGVIEQEYGSADRTDVEFRYGDSRLAVEIKSHLSPDDDIIRGIFQCIKYKHLARAHQRLDELIPDADAVLVVGRDMPARAREYANALEVRWFVVKPPAS